ncbi:MAG: membrane dipeptidase [Vicinamibacterales bacterium]|jgi:membrane dipeptidase|nr:hypothetical protein [Acidobacteriota bacterium]MDP7295249.1 membrane dipeptidase [Vicinamibacterales bacterium]MDP7471860.1 membrane dipeptidase [Vicinamibacterales bacterium]MDP7672426.1 membrane dipeptidase [Vicinamibacterales bacterium]HJO38501.1 membrane dipeptidase [Vicinamibacterales bacterium]|tara:strand:+ start:695 stop:1837 length:1143 start_codon:yes stop_codon:yes gene_type:complete
MNRREFLGTVGAGAVAGATARPAAMPQASGAPAEIYARAYAIDAMCFAMAPPPATFVQYLTPDKVEALRTSGLTAMAMNMTSNFAELSQVENMFGAVKDRIATWDAIVAANPDVFRKVTTTAELDAVKQSGHVGFIYCFQMSAPFGWDLAKLRTFAELGVRQIQLADGSRNYLVDSCWEHTNAGLSRFGHQTVEAFAELGILVDLSHVGERSSLDAILASPNPAIYSHSGCLPLCPHPRNVSDRNVRALAERGGVFCVYNQSGWLTQDPEISIDHFIAHLAHVIDLGGEDAVGVGTDQDAVDMTAMRPTEVADHNGSFERRRQEYPELAWEIRHMRVPELSHPRRLLHLAEALDARGYRPATIEKILGGNYVRVFREVVG